MRTAARAVLNSSKLLRFVTFTVQLVPTAVAVK